MKKIVTSAGMIALGVMGAQVATSMAQDSGKTLPWLNASLSVRGFYDDNVATQSAASGLKKDSFGTSVSPRVGASMTSGTTSASMSYKYDMRWYEDRSNSADHSHQFNAGLKHDFTENYKLDINEQFVIAQEADLLNELGGAPFQVMRVDGSNMRNTAGFNLDGKFSPTLGARVGYKNSFYDFEDDYHAYKLNRMEHTSYLDLTYDVQQSTQAYLGYQNTMTGYDFDGLDPASAGGTTGWFNTPSKAFDNMSHYIYVGARHTLAQGLDLDLRGGVEITQWDNINLVNPAVPGKRDDSVLNPYVKLGVTYAYAEGSTAQVGVLHSRGATQFDALDQESTSFYATLNHKITPRINGRLIGQYQMSDYNTLGLGTVANGDGNYYTLGAELEYLIYKGVANVSTELGYNFDQVDTSDNGYTYSRNRVYLGLKVSY